MVKCSVMYYVRLLQNNDCICSACNVFYFATIDHVRDAPKMRL